MRKKGFTLIEVLAMIVILGVLVTVIAPSAFYITRSSKQRAYTNLVEVFKNSANMYVSRNRAAVNDDIDTTGTSTITLQDLADLKLIKESLTDPRNNTPISLSKKVYAYKDENGAIIVCYEDEHCLLPGDNAPLISVVGSNPATVLAGSTYTDEGATAVDNVDGDITSLIVINSNVNPNVPGIYAVTYSVTNSLGIPAISVSRIVTVVDVAVPTVAFGTNGNTVYAKSRSTTVTVSDNIAINSSSLKYLWNTNTAEPSEGSFSTTFTNGGTISSPAGVTGGYYLWILAKDTSNNTTIFKTNVFNLDNSASSTPTVSLNGYTSGQWTTSNITFTIVSTDADSGIQKYQYSWDNGSTWNDMTNNGWTYNWDANDSLIFRVLDNAGNISSNTSTYVFRRDATSPTTPTVSLNGYTSGSWTKNNVTQTFSSSDATSGIQKYQYSNNGGSSWNDIANPWVINWDGQWTLYIRAVDNAGNASTASSSYIIRRDTVAPTISMNGSSPVVLDLYASYSDAGATASDNSSGINQSWSSSTVVTSYAGTYNVTYSATDNAGNAATPVVRTVVVFEYDYAYNYTGNYQTFTAPRTGTYRLEVWGAQGGADGVGAGGLGGYSAGNVSLSTGQTLYAYVGSAGASNVCGTGGGWNGGGASGVVGASGAGGGATDIRAVGPMIFNGSNGLAGTNGGYISGTNVILPPGGIQYGPYASLSAGSYRVVINGDNVSSGSARPYYNFSANQLDYWIITAVPGIGGNLVYLLSVPQNISNFENALTSPAGVNITVTSIVLEKFDSRLIIAGGGGGGGNNNGAGSTGGTGGGSSGGNGVNSSTNGATQSSGGTSPNASGSWTQGAPHNSDGGGGGGGLFGGGAGNGDNGGGGGSGYIGGVSSATTANGVRTGNGYAKITYIP